MAVDSFCVGIFRNETAINFGFLLENRFKVSLYGKGNFNPVLSTMESYKGILFRHVYPDRFIVYTIKPGFHYTANATTTTQKQSD